MRYIIAIIGGGILMNIVKPQFGWTVGIMACLLLGLLIAVIYHVQDSPYN